jgi:hypothetical protein
MLLGLVFTAYAVVRAMLGVSAHFPNDLSSTLVTLALIVMGDVLGGIGYWQARPYGRTCYAG